MGRTTCLAALTVCAMFTGCGGCGDQGHSELAYLWAEKGKYPKREGVLDSQPLQHRLENLLQGRYGTFIDNWDAEGPLDPKANTLFASGCVSHFCDEYGSAFHVDLAKDELIAIMRIKYKVEVFRERDGAIDDLPAEVKEWIGESEVAKGNAGPEAPAAESTGAFEWKAWADAPEAWKKELKRIKADRKQSVHAQAEETAAMPCEVRIARYDLDGDGKPGTIVTYSCEFWCGQVGCAFNVYEGGKRIALVDEIDQVQPTKGGVISSRGVVLELK